MQPYSARLFLDSSAAPLYNEENNCGGWISMSERITYKNGTIYTGEGFAECFTVEDGKFLYAGSLAGCPADTGKVVDLGGRFVCAGFNDSHMHLLNLGQTLDMANLSRHTASLEDVLDCLRAYIAEVQPAPGTWVRGRGFNQDYFSGEHRFPSRYDLDRVSTEHPICITRACGHICVVNSKALELLGIDKNTPQPVGGRFHVDESGEPTGQFFENALDLIYKPMPAPDKAALTRMVKKACARLNSYGITSCQSDDYETIPNLGYKPVMTLLSEMAETGELTVRINEQVHFTNLPALTAFVEAGDHRRGNARFKNGPLKMLGDGSLGARTAYLSRPYADDPSTCGIPVYTQQQFDEMCSFANRNEMSIAIHSIGDGILDCILDAYEKALAACPREHHRHGIVHCQITRPDQLKRIQDMGLHVYLQSIFIDYDSRIVRDRVGDELASTSYAAKSLLQNGVTFSNGSDAPVEDPVVLRGIECAVTRRSIGTQNAPYRPEEALTVGEAIDSFTKDAAYASFEENVKGCIKAGMLADFVILGGNPFEADPDTLHDIPVLETWLGGECVYKKA